jgi:hypothetical protein
VTRKTEGQMAVSDSCLLGLPGTSLILKNKLQGEKELQVYKHAETRRTNSRINNTFQSE